MAIIPTNTLITILDSVASGKLIFDLAVGTSSSQANTTAKAANNDLATLAAISDPQVQNDLAQAFWLRATGVLAQNLYTTLGGYNLWWALDKHTANAGVAGVTGLDTFLQVNNVRVSQNLQQIGFPLSAEQIMPPATTMGTFVATGANAGTYTHVADIDTTQYGRAWLALTVTSSSGTGGAALNATVTGLQFDQTTQTSLTVTIAAGSSQGTVVNVGTLGTQTQSYDSLTGVTITGGSAGDAFTVVSRVERTIAAVS